MGWVFGVNQKGRYGGMQLIVATDVEGRILHAYYQRLSAPERDAFVAEAFTERFRGLTLADFYYHRGYSRLGVERPEDRLGAIRPPAESEAARHDLRATLRGMQKALILFDTFWLKDRHEAVFQKVRAKVEKGGTRGGAAR